jgi:ATP-dependent helicase HrpB
VLAARERGVSEEVATLSAWIAEGESEGLDLFDTLPRKRPPNVNRLREQILASAAKGAGANKSQKPEEDAAKCLLEGFPDRVAKKRGTSKGAEVDLVFAAGGAAVVSRRAAVDKNEFFLVLDVQERGRQGEGKLRVHVHTLCPIQADWLLDLKNDLIREDEALIWDAERGKVYETARLTYGDLVLSEDRGEPRDAAAASRLLLKEAFGIDAANPPEVPDLLKLLERHVDPEPVEAFLARLRLLKSDEATSEFLIRSLAGLTSLKDLHPAAFQERMEAAVSPSVLGELARSLPMHFFLKGRRVKVHYKWGEKPWIASRLQDFFGMTQGPAILGGKLPLTLHLLAPNQRPVQVTQDLASFWKNAYPQIRKELSRKYPRHKWPENPLAI